MRRLFLLLVFWGSMPAFFIDPFYGIVHYSLINIIRPEQLLWGDQTAAGRVFLGSQAAIFLAWLFKKDDLKPEDTPVPFQIKIMLFLIVAIHISGLFGITLPALQSKWSSHFMKVTLFCFMLAKCMNSAKKLELYYAVTTFWFMLLQIWGIQQKLGGNERMEGLGGEQLGGVNELAAVAVLYFPMAYYMLYSRKKWIRIGVGIPTTVISLVFILFGGSRGAFLGLAVCIVLILLRTPGLQKFKIIFTFVFVGTLLYFTLNLIAPEGFFDEYTARLQTITGEEDQTTGEVEYEGSASGRIAMWKAVYYFMRQHPEFWLTGLGMRGFQARYFDYIDQIEPHLEPEEVGHIYYGGVGGKAIHNSYLNMLTSGGLLVFFPWLFLIFYAIIQAHFISKKYPKIIEGVNIYNYAWAVEIGIIGVCVCMIFGNTEFVDFYYWFFLMSGIITNLGKAQQRRERLGQEDEYEEEVTMVRRYPAYSSYH
ncbi:MAG: O-antigen ligase family protein [Candidatus Vecturithrix sp.]|jgi:O-antigen ligase|nr:O-antigen ligase family protein [Candidatus Vecturithrix sp.]